MKITSLKRKNIRAVRFLSSVFTAIALILSTSHGSSLAFTTYEGSYDDSAISLQRAASFKAPVERSILSVPPSAQADVCLPLLKRTSYTPSASVFDRNQRSAGKAAALGLIFGARFALSQSEQAVIDAQKWARLDVMPHQVQATGDNRSALSVSAYRDCQKQKALNALSASR